MMIGKKATAADDGGGDSNCGDNGDSGAAVNGGHNRGTDTRKIVQGDDARANDVSYDDGHGDGGGDRGDDHNGCDVDIVGNDDNGDDDGDDC